MLRRFGILFLVLACALTPVLPTHAAIARANDCCCDDACRQPDCAPPPCAPVRAPLTSLPTVEQRDAVAKPALRVAAAAFHLFTAFEISRRPLTRPLAASRIALADSVALYQAHCSLLI